MKDVQLTVEEQERVDAILEQHEQGVPLAKIMKVKNFWNDKFVTTFDTLDPRPETETLIETVLDYFPDRSKDYKILDLGTGTGCLILSLLQEFPAAKGIGVDICPKALKIAHENRRRHKLVERCQLLESDWLERIDGRFDIIVCNPPYVKMGDPLLNQGALYDPAIALYGGNETYEKILERLHLFMKKHAFFEIGPGITIKAKEPYHIVETRKDLLKEDRVVVLSI